MTVYVDDPRKGWSHMVADTLPELFAMADAVGLRREWFQSHPRHPHFDIKWRKRRDAIRRGAVETVRLEAARIARRCGEATDD